MRSNQNLFYSFNCVWDFVFNSLKLITATIINVWPVVDKYFISALWNEKECTNSLATGDGFKDENENFGHGKMTDDWQN